MIKKLINTGCILCFIFIFYFYAGFAGTYPNTDNAEKILYLQPFWAAQAVPAIEKTHMDTKRTDGRVPGTMQYDDKVMSYDPNDTIYYKAYYDDFNRGLVMQMDTSPDMKLQDELEDYFIDKNEWYEPLDYLVSMFYDDRTIEMGEDELERLFWEHGYDISFHNAEYEDYHLRFVEITERKGMSLYPVRILMQTWDDEFIYLQDITGPIPRTIKELMMVDRDGIWQMVVHSSGFSRDYVVEEELSFWEFHGTYWILIPMELRIDTSHAYYLGDYGPDLDRDGLFEAIYYRDGIAYRPSLQNTNFYGDKAVIRLGVMETVEENKRFRLEAVYEVEGRTVRKPGCYIQFEIMEEGENEENVQNEEIPYYVPLNEIGEKIEYAYACGQMWTGIAGEEFDGLGYLPVGKKFSLSVYLTEGNKILFLPDGMGNQEILLKDGYHDLYYSEQDEGYCFFLIRDWQTEEAGVPVNSPENPYSIETCTVKEKTGYEFSLGDIQSYRTEFDLDSLVSLGKIEVFFDPKAEAALPSVLLAENEYIDSAVREAQCILAGQKIYGDFEMYVGRYGRSARIESACEMTGCIMGNDLEQYFHFVIYDNGKIEKVWPYASGEGDMVTYFINEYHRRALPDHIFRTVTGEQRGPISFQVVEGQDYPDLNPDLDTQNWGSLYKDNDCGTDFYGMEAERAGEYLDYVISYSEWFGMNELGYQAGKLRGLDGKEVRMYVEGGDRSSLYFAPIGEDGKEKDYYMVMGNAYADQEGQLGVSICEPFNGNRQSLKELGTTTIHIRELPSFSVPAIKEDEYIRATEEYVKDLLVQGGKSGEYRMYIGEYTAGSDSNKACISAAVSGGEGEEYYVRYLIVKSQTGKYYFWPTGFGLNGSLEECAADRHYMNRLCIERTKLLGRSEYEIIIP